MVYTLAERIQMILIYGAEKESARKTADTFNRRNAGKNVHHKYVTELVAKFKETGSVANRKRTNRNVLDEAAEIEVLGHFNMDPTSSLRKVSALTGLSYSSVRKVTKLHKFHPYKLQIHQELGEDDYDRRVEFCEVMTNMINNNRNLIKNICFSDECTFFLHGFVNKHNCRYWSDENPHIFREDHSQTPEKLNVWAGILGDTIIGPVFIDGNLNGDIYLDLLENIIDPLIVDALENQRDEEGNLILSEELLYFQQDGAPPHYRITVRQWLNDRFPNRWIGRRGPIEWPARSPDLTSPDFFLWGHLKSVVYKTPPENIADLRQRITQECRSIPSPVFQKVREEFESRLYHCMDRNGEHFEHLL